MTGRKKRGPRGTRGTPKKAKPPVVLPAKLSAHSDAVKAKALEAYAIAGTVKAACLAAGIGRRTWYNWMEDDATFARAVIDATEEVTDELENEAVRRAKDGSDTLLIFLLKANRRAKYGDKQMIEVVSPKVQECLQSMVNRIGARETWTRQELWTMLDEVWRT